jgi:hypothetical protein
MIQVVPDISVSSMAPATMAASAASAATSAATKLVCPQTTMNAISVIMAGQARFTRDGITGRRARSGIGT